MTARPVDPESRRRPLSIAVALVLVMVAVLLAAGCVLPGFDNITQLSPEEKYVFLEHQTNESSVTISGHCFPMNGDCYLDPSSPYTIDEKKGVLDVTDYRNQKEPVNDSLVLFYGDQDVSNRHWCHLCSGSFLYSLPWQSGNITIESVTEDGTVALRYDDVPIVLKPKERWEKITRKTKYSPPLRSATNSIKFSKGSVFIGEDSFECTEEITITDSIYNAGVFDKKGIVAIET
ncbi:MAG: hypothetical protein WC379_16270 [Methanoregula sp.]|jgi:hypothetical protein